MGDLINGPGGPHTERNPPVGRVKCQRDRGQQQRTGPPPDPPRHSASSLPAVHRPPPPLRSGNLLRLCYLTVGPPLSAYAGTLTPRTHTTGAEPSVRFARTAVDGGHASDR